jgi:hypothetical protein
LQKKPEQGRVGITKIFIIKAGIRIKARILLINARIARIKSGYQSFQDETGINKDKLDNGREIL